MDAHTATCYNHGTPHLPSGIGPHTALFPNANDGDPEGSEEEKLMQNTATRSAAKDRLQVNVRLDRELRALAIAIAAQEDKSFGDFVEEAVTEAVQRKQGTALASLNSTADAIRERTTTATEPTID